MLQILGVHGHESSDDLHMLIVVVVGKNNNLGLLPEQSGGHLLII
jgi:hypothetical protein